MAKYIGTRCSQFPCASVQMKYSLGENSYGCVLKGQNSGGKKVNEKRAERYGKKGEKGENGVGIRGDVGIVNIE